MRIVIETIPHESQRYPTCGDWWIDPDGTWQIRVSRLSREFNRLHRHMEILIAVHELTEMLLCDAAGVYEVDVTTFDEDHAKAGAEGEPGDSSVAPYYKQHQFATGIERILAAEMRIPWTLYEATIDELS